MKHILIIIFLISVTQNFWGQSPENTTEPALVKINEKIAFHRKQHNFDSTIYYLDLQIDLQIRRNNPKGIILALDQKINKLIEFNRQSEAFHLALSTFDAFCNENRDPDNCSSCRRVYAKLADFMTIMQDYRQGFRYLDMICMPENNVDFYYKKAKLYHLLKLPDSALMLTSEFISISAKLPDPTALINAYNTHGLIAKQLNRLDEAIEAFSAAISIADSINMEPKRFAYILGNLATCYYKKGEFDKAYEYLLIDSKISLKEKFITSFIRVETNLAEIEIIRKEYADASNRLNNLLTTYDKELAPDLRLRIIEILVGMYETTGNVPKHNLYSNQWIELGKVELQNKFETHQKLVDEMAGNSLKRITHQMETEKQLLNQKLITQQREEEKNILKNHLLLMGLTLVLLIALFGFFRYRSISKLKQTQLESAAYREEVLELKMKKENRNVQALSLELIEKQGFSLKLIKQLKQLKNVSLPELKQVILFIQNELAIKSTRATLQSQMGDLSGEFHAVLCSKYPHLTEMDLKLAAMVAMNMSNKEIAISKNITPASVKKTKTRLKRKLNLSIEDDLYHHLKTILNKR